MSDLQGLEAESQASLVPMNVQQSNKHPNHHIHL